MASDLIILPSAVRTVSGNSADFRNNRTSGIIVYLDITAASGTLPTLDVKLQTKDPASGKYIDIAGAAFAVSIIAGTKVLRMIPGITVVANQDVAASLPYIWRVAYVIGGTTPSFTFSVGASLV